MKKVLFALMAAVVMSMAFTACSDKKSSKDEKDKTEVKGDAEEENDGDDEDTAETTTLDAGGAFGDVTGSSAEQYMALTKKFISIIKSTHINSQADIDALKAVGKEYKTRMEALQQELENMSKEEQMKIAGEMMSLVGELQSLEKEAKRLDQEAAAIGANLDDFGID